MIRRARLEGSSFLRWALAFSALASIAACGAEAPEWVAGDSDEQSALAAPELLARGALRLSQRQEMPVELKAAYIRTVQTDAPETYAAGVVRPDEFRLRNAAQSFDAKVDLGGVELAAREASWSFSLRTSEMGCEGAVVSLAEPSLDADGNRVRYVRTGIEEWYLNGPLGIEQGFVVDEAPACAGVKVIQMRTSGDLRAELDDVDGDGQGQSIRFVGAEGNVALSMSHLYVTDANGENLPAWLSVDAGKISIHFDDRGAKYPIDIDPLIAVLEAKIPTPGNTPNDQFGDRKSVV